MPAPGIPARAPSTSASTTFRFTCNCYVINHLPGVWVCLPSSLPEHEVPRSCPGRKTSSVATQQLRRAVLGAMRCSRHTANPRCHRGSAGGVSGYHCTRPAGNNPKAQLIARSAPCRDQLGKARRHPRGRGTELASPHDPISCGTSRQYHRTPGICLIET